MKAGTRSLPLPASLFGPLLRPLGSLDETPVDGNRLSENLSSVQSLLGSQRLFVGLEFHQRVSLEESRSSVQIQVDVLDVAEFAELLLDVVLLGLLVDVRDEQNPTLDG